MSLVSYALKDFAYQALRDLGALRAGQGLGADELNDILQSANQMIDSWAIDDLMLFTWPSQIFNLQAMIQQYTIGPTGVFVAVRPQEIEFANVILNTVNPVVRVPMDILDVVEWASIRVQQIPSALPLKLWYDRQFDADGNGTIHIWPGPISNYDLELFIPQQLQSFVDATTVYTFPPGYAAAIRSNLAVSIAPMVEISNKLVRTDRQHKDMFAQVRYKAAQDKELLESYNARAKVLPADPAFMSQRRRGWNYVLGVSGTGY
jgi:hypothetical protein